MCIYRLPTIYVTSLDTEGQYFHFNENMERNGICSIFIST